MAFLIACFVLALFIYFAFYYQKDKKAMQQRGKIKARKSGEDFIIFPFLDEDRDGSQKDISDPSGDHDDICENNFED